MKDMKYKYYEMYTEYDSTDVFCYIKTRINDSMKKVREKYLEWLYETHKINVVQSTNSREVSEAFAQLNKIDIDMSR